MKFNNTNTLRRGRISICICSISMRHRRKYNFFWFYYVKNSIGESLSGYSVPVPDDLDQFDDGICKPFWEISVSDTLPRPPESFSARSSWVCPPSLYMNLLLRI